MVSALLHDIGDIYAPYNHDEYAAKIAIAVKCRPASCAMDARRERQFKCKHTHVTGL